MSNYLFLLRTGPIASNHIQNILLEALVGENQKLIFFRTIIFVDETINKCVQGQGFQLHSVHYKENQLHN